MICKHIFLITILNEPELNFLDCEMVSSISIKYEQIYLLLIVCLHISVAIVSTQLNGFNYYNLTLTILFDINHLFAHSEVDTSIAIWH